MNKGLKILISVVSLLWLSGAMLIYFNTVQIHPGVASCGDESVCIGPKSNPIVKIEPRSSHRYFKDAWDNISGYDLSSIGSAGETRSGPLVPIVLWVVVLYGIYVVVARYGFNQKEINLKLSPAILLGLFSVVFFIVESQWQNFYGMGDSMGNGGGIFGMYLGIVISLLFLLLVLTSLGDRTWKFFFSSLELSALSQKLIAFGLGSLGVTVLAFLLLLFHSFTTVSLWITLLIILGICGREAWGNIKGFFRRSIAFTSAWYGLPIFLGAVFSIIASHNILELLRPIPIGFDDLGLYMIIPKVLFERASLISGIDSYAWGILMSFGFTLFHSATVTLFISGVMSIMALIATYAIVKRYCEKRAMEHGGMYALFISVFLYTVPTIIFQSSKDMKFDLASFFFQLLSVLVFMEFFSRENDHSLLTSAKDLVFHGSEKKKRILLLALLGLFLGFSFVIKYTSLFLVLALGIVTLVVILMQKMEARRKVLEIGILALAAFAPLLPIIPGVAYNIIKADSVSLATFRVGPSESPMIPVDPPLGPVKQTVGGAASTGVREELGRYLGYQGGWRDYLALPITVTTNPLTAGLYIDIGYLFLGLVPLVVFVFSIPPDEETRGRRLRLAIIVMGVLYWLIWSALANGVIWYGYGGFIFLMLMMVEVLSLIALLDVTQYAFYVLIGFWFVAITVARSAFLPEYQLSMNKLGLNYAKGVLYEDSDSGDNKVFDAEAFLKNWIPTYVTIRDTVNATLASDPSTNIYRIGTFTKYFIRDSFAHVLDDNQLDVFAQVSSDGDDVKTIQRLKNGHFKYLIIDTNTTSIDHTPEQTLTKKYNNLNAFIDRNPKNFKKILDDNGVLFVEVL